MSTSLTVVNLAVIEHPESWPWLVGLGAGFVLVGLVVTLVVTRHDRTLDEPRFCFAPGPVEHGVEGFCRLVNGHDGHHVNLLGGAFTVQLTACWVCSEGLFRWSLKDRQACDACGHSTDLTTDLYLLEGERIANYEGWAVIVCPVPTSSVD